MSLTLCIFPNFAKGYWIKDKIKTVPKKVKESRKIHNEEFSIM
jgi:hypothetical protein